MPAPAHLRRAARPARAAAGAVWGLLLGASAAVGEGLVLADRNLGELTLSSAALLIAELALGCAALGAAAGALVGLIGRRSPRLAGSIAWAALPGLYLLASWFGEWNTGRPYWTPVALVGAAALASFALGVGYVLHNFVGRGHRAGVWLTLILWPPLFAGLSLLPYFLAPYPAKGALQPRPPADSTQRKRVLVLALDGLDPTVIRELAGRGELPHLAALMQKGSWSPLESLPLQASPSLWTSAFTGVPAERHGISDFIALDGLPGGTLRRTTYPAVPLLPLWNRLILPGALQLGILQRRITGSQDRLVPAVWDLAAQAGDSCAVLGLLGTHPAEGRAVQVSDRFFLGRPQSVTPAALSSFLLRLRPTRRERLAELRPVLHLTSEDWRELNRGEGLEGPLLTLDRALERDAAVAAAARALLRARRFDLALVYLRLADDLSHAAWAAFRPHQPAALYGLNRQQILRFHDLVPGAYRYLDRRVGELSSLMGGDAVLIVLSDHGFSNYRFGDSHYQSPPGLLVISGPGIRVDAELRSPSLIDLTSTLLLLRGQPIPSDLVGRPWTEALSGDLRRALGLRVGAPLPRRRPGASTPGSPLDRELLERFRALGYLR